MLRRTLTGVSLAAVAVLTVTLIWQNALAGPPLICHEIEIGDHASLPWGDEPFKKDRRFDEKHVIAKTLGVLKSDTPVLVRMETLRRAALYIDNDRATAAQLLNGLMARVLDAEIAGKSDALAWFDAGYLVQVYDQLGRSRSEVDSLGAKGGVAGYAWVCRAIDLRGEDGSMQFAAALMTALADGDVCDGHLEKARSAAGDDALLAANIKLHEPLIAGHRAYRSSSR